MKLFVKPCLILRITLRSATSGRLLHVAFMADFGALLYDDLATSRASVAGKLHYFSLHFRVSQCLSFPLVALIHMFISYGICLLSFLLAFHVEFVLYI